MEPYTENTKMPFGKYCETQLKDVPFTYFQWLKAQDWFTKSDKWTRLKAYIKALKKPQPRKKNSGPVYKTGATKAVYKRNMYG